MQLNIKIPLFSFPSSEANDLALQLCRRVTGHTDAIVFEGAFHGSMATVACLSPR